MALFRIWVPVPILHVLPVPEWAGFTVYLTVILDLNMDKSIMSSGLHGDSGIVTVNSNGNRQCTGAKKLWVQQIKCFILPSPRLWDVIMVIS